MATAATQSKPKALTVGAMIDTLHRIREQKRELSTKEKELNAEYELIHNQLINTMDAEGVTKSTGKLASASLTESQQFNVEDWEKFMPYVARLKRWDLVQRRVSAPAVRELAAIKGTVPPGLAQFVKREISLRNI